MMQAQTGDRIRRWFAADDCYLAIDTDRANDVKAIRGLQDAVTLADRDSLLVDVYNWTGVDFDWQPVDELPNPPDLTHTVTLLSDSEHCIGLALSSDRLTDLPPVDEAMQQRVHIQAHTVSARILLDRISLSQEDAQKLSPGSVLLLAASYAEQWLATLQFDEAIEQSARVYVQPASGMLYFHSWHSAEQSAASADADNAVEPCCDVYLQHGASIDLNTWQSAEPSDGTVAATDAFFHRLLTVELHSDDKLSYQATLVPLGDGYAAALSADQ